MSDVVIRAEGLSKRYRLGKQARYKALRDSLTDLLYAPGRMARAALRGERRPTGQDDRELWALKDVSFEVRRGEVVGIIGRNGAGKSTLLKILSRITTPTAGRVGVRGRVGSLLEVGTGFHPELTGRENILLNGAILGMRRAEILRKFDEIVAFAEVERFIDTPVKHYSSGMYMRLAFAVAAHLEPEVLVVDEVLAVGDAEFQRKCLGKMGEVAREGRTVLFVSHQLNQIRRLTSQAIWLEAGQVRAIEATATVIGKYEAALSANAEAGLHYALESHAAARFVSWSLLSPRQEELNVLYQLGPVTVGITLQAQRDQHHCRFGVALYSDDNILMWANSLSGFDLRAGRTQFAFTLPSLPLRPGLYRWVVSLYGPNGLVDLWNCTPDLIIAVEPVTHPSDEWQGLLNLAWAIEVRTP